MATLKELEASLEAPETWSLEGGESTWTSRPGEPTWPPRPGGVGAVLEDGLAAGLIGYGAVIAVVALVDVLNGLSPFHTPAHLGAWLFLGLEDPAGMEITPQAVLAYNGLHLLASLAVGMMGALLVREVERFHGLWYFALMAFIAGTTYTLAVVGAVGGELGGALEWSTVLAGTTAWFAAMTGYFWRTHKELPRRIAADLDEEA